jgi:hypothetical protein
VILGIRFDIFIETKTVFKMIISKRMLGLPIPVKMSVTLDNVGACNPHHRTPFLQMSTKVIAFNREREEAERKAEEERKRKEEEERLRKEEEERKKREEEERIRVGLLSSYLCPCFPICEFDMETRNRSLPFAHCLRVNVKILSKN